MGFAYSRLCFHFVYDISILRHLASTEMKGKVKVLAPTFERQDDAFALPEGSFLREPINRALLKIIAEPKWQELLYRYLGR